MGAARIGLGALLLGALGCSETYLELQIADADLPFLEAGRDFDALSVDTRAVGCANASVRYPAAPLPATLTVVPGPCYQGAFELAATAWAGARAIARSAWVPAEFGRGLVLTATLADLPGRRTLFSTGFEAGEPGGELGPLPLVGSLGARGLSAEVSADHPLTGARSALLGATLSATSARALARVAVLNLLLAEGDELVFTLELEAGSAITAAGVEVELSSGATAEALRLEDRSTGRPISPGSAVGRRLGVREQWVVDLSAAAGTRLVGLVFGSAPAPGQGGSVRIRLDDLAVARP